MFGNPPWQLLDVFPSLILAVGGVWALFVYRTARRGEVKVAIEHDVRLVREFSDGRALLLIGIKLRNVSDVLWRWKDSSVTLFDARRVTGDGEIRLVPFSQADPFLPVYGLTADDPQDIEDGRPFSYFEDQEISVEPGEQVQTEVSFILDSSRLGLMAVKIWFSGLQRTRSRHPYEWASFFYVHPDETSAPLKMGEV